MKVLILTHPLEVNYGGILQNFALQRVLKDMGHDVLTIDCHNDKSFLYKLMSWGARIIRHYILRQKNIPIKYSVNKSGKSKLRENPELKRFITENIKLTKYIQSYDKLKKVLKYNPECIIVGSDQVWLKQYFPYTFLQFAKNFHCIKISYAASGDLIWLSGFNKLAKCREYILSFTALSVREDTMVSTCIDYLGVRPQWVLDPVFLVDKEVYLSLIVNTSKLKNTLATYILDENPSKINFIEHVAADKKLAINKTYQTGITKNIPSLEQWLSSIIYSDFVVTDSFHGMVLSILFNKQFIVIGNTKRGLDRFYSVLGKFDLKDRFLDENNLSKSSVVNLPDIDYKIVNRKIGEERTKSFDFLIKSLSVK